MKNIKKTKYKYDPNGFDVDEKNKDTGYMYNPNEVIILRVFLI